MNSCLSHLIDELWIQKMVGSEVFLWNQRINSLILISGMNLWCPIIKRKEIIMWTRVYPNWKMNFNSKIDRKRNLFFETKPLISFIQMRRINLWCPIIERKEIITWIHVYPNWKTNFNSKNGKKRSFVMKQNINIINPNKENVLMVPNHGKKGDYYENPCLFNW